MPGAVDPSCPSTPRRRRCGLAIATALGVVGALGTVVASPVGKADSPRLYIASPAQGAQLTGTAAVIRVHDELTQYQGCEPVWTIDGKSPVHDAFKPWMSEPTFDSTRYPDGEHTFVIRSECYGPDRDLNGYGDKSVYESVRQFVIRNVAPRVTVTAPAGESTVAGRAVPVSAEVQTDPQGKQHVTSVAFELDGAQLETDELAPYESSFDSTRLTNGPHDLRVTATDSAGLVSSVETTFVVGNYRSNVIADVERERVPVGTPTTVTGSLGRVEDGAPIEGALVELQVRRADQSGWARAATVRSGPDGALVASRPESFSSFYRWRFAGDLAHSAAQSAEVKVTVVPTARMTLASTTVRRGTTVKGSVRLNPPAGGQPLIYQYRKVGTGWVNGSSVNSAPTTTPFTVRFTAPGTYEVRTQRRATSTGASTVSNVVRLRVS